MRGPVTQWPSGPRIVRDTAARVSAGWGIGVTSKRFLLLILVTGLVMGPGVRAEAPPPSDGYDAKGKRDPFMALVRDGRLVWVSATPTISASSLSLLGILWDARGSSLALINDSEVKVGDMLGDYQVAEIRQDAVVLMRDGEPLVLQITFEPPAPGREPFESPE